MKRIALIIALFASPLAAAPEDDRVAARAAAHEMAGAWSNDGFKIRDGHWTGTIKLGHAKVVQVNLYAGNQYWFTAASVGKAKKISVTVYDETGKPVGAQFHEDGVRAAAGFSPSTSGPYLVKLEIADGEASEVALVYSFK